MPQKIDTGGKPLLTTVMPPTSRSAPSFPQGPLSYAGKRAAPALQKAIQHSRRTQLKSDLPYAPAYAGLAERASVPLAFDGPSEAK